MANLEFFDAIAAAVSSGIFIPVSDLPGSSSTEFASGKTTNQKQGQFAYSVIKALRTILTGTNFLNTPQNETDVAITKPNKLGMTLTTTETSGGVGLKNRVFNLTTTYLGKKVDNTLNMIPTAASGTYSGMGDFNFDDIFPNAAKVTAAADVPGAGVLVPSAELVNYGSVAHVTINLATDGRRLIAALMSWLFSKELALRTTTTASSITDLTRAVTTLDLPAVAIAATNPSSGLLSADVGLYLISNESLIYTIQTIDNDDETISPNVIVTP
jgi:hypothetical protein